MKSITLILCALALFVPSISGQNKVNLTVYYESLCPYSVAFLREELGPVYPPFGEYINLELVPFGISKSVQGENGVSFTCQHGTKECAGNKVQSCGLHFAQSQAAQMKFVQCKMGQGTEGTDQCAENAGLSYESVMECYSGELGTKLQLAAEAKTKEYAAPKEIIPFVPNIVYNNEYDENKQSRSHSGELADVLCEEIKAISNELPSVC